MPQEPPDNLELQVDDLNGRYEDSLLPIGVPAILTCSLPSQVYLLVQSL